MHPSGVNTDLLIPAEHSVFLSGWFGWWIRRMFRRSFNAVRFEGESADVLRRLGERRGPALVAMNHQSWWDPLIGLLVGGLLTPARPVMGPMQADQLKKFAIFRKVGVFGIEPDDPASLGEMVKYVRWSFAQDPARVLWITPQGEFVDPRAEVRVRPGASAVAARLSDEPAACDVVVLAIEMVFWIDQRPEVLLRAADVRCHGDDRSSTIAWTRALNAAMRDNASALANASITRDPARFRVVYSAEGVPRDGDDVGGRINPLVDLWLRLRGQSARLDARRRSRDVAVRSPALASIDARSSERQEVTR